MNWKEDYWRLISADVITGDGPRVSWRTVYNLVDEKGSDILTETQVWSLQEQNGKFMLDLEWTGEAKTDVIIEKFYVGGLFLRMPWHEGIEGDVVNAAEQRNEQAEGQRAIWTDTGLKIDGREDHGHIAILDHPDNKAFPTPWRVDNELGVGPSRQILADWTIPQGERESIRYRLIIYTGTRDENEINNLWKTYVCEHARLNISKENH